MNRAMIGLLVVLAMSLLGQTLKRLAEFGGIPNLFPYVRDLLLVAIFIWSLSRTNLFSNVRLASSLLLFLFIFCIYIMISALEGRHFIGLYYARVYLLPIFFLVAIQVSLQAMSFEGVIRVLHWTSRFNLLLLLSAFFLYALVQFVPSERVLLFGSSVLPSAWYISGGTFMRMGLPLTGPNSLGIFSGLSLLMAILVILALPSGERGRKFYVFLAICNIIALIATLSRSALLMVVLGGFSLLLVPSFRRRKLFSRIISIFVGIVAVAVTAGLLVELISEGFLSRWIALNLNFQDPSIRGHWHSIVGALQDFYQYAWYGYERGTVGPKSSIVVGVSNNVENSVLGVIYDFGVFGALLFFLAYGLLLAEGYKTRLQIPFLVGFFVSLQLLPFIFEPEIISFFIFIFLLIGHLDRVGFLSRIYEFRENNSSNRLNSIPLVRAR